MNSRHLLDKHTALFIGRGARSSVQGTAKNLAQDIEEACGFRPPLHTGRANTRGLAIVIESNGKLARQFGIASKLTAPESFAIRAVRLDGRDAVLISGTDERGTIHGIYHFSQTHLGTDPIKFWTGYRPPRRSRIPLGNVDHDSVTPTFRHRGFHLERNDDVHGWRSADGKVGFHVFWEKVFETILRLRGNMVKPGTNNPRSAEVALAQKMGLMITQEHGAPLGVWAGEIGPNDPSFRFSFRENRKVFIDAWETAMQCYPRPENVIWTVGFRGRGDNPFWIDDPSARTDVRRGAIITEALQTQVDLVKRRFGHLNPTFIHNLWMEGVRMYRDGHVRVPEEAHVVWADNGYGTFRAMLASGCTAEQMRPSMPDKPTGGRDGVYCHVSMYDGNAPDLGQFVPPSRIRREFTKVLERESTFYLLVNVGRVREQVLGASAVMEVARNAAPWVDRKRDGAEDFWRRWCRKYFGAAAKDARQCYDLLYKTPFRWGTWGGWDDYVVGDYGYYRRARYLVMEALSMDYRKQYEAIPLKFWLHKTMTLKQQATYLRRCAAPAAKSWEMAKRKADATMKKLSGGAREFFEANVLAQIEVHRHSNSYLLHIIDAVMLYEQAKHAEAEAQIKTAIECAHRIRSSMLHMERGQWRGWCKTNYWSGWEIAQSTAEMFLHVVQEFQLTRRG